MIFFIRKSSDFKTLNQSLYKFSIFESNWMRTHLKRFFFLRITLNRIGILKNLHACLRVISLAEVFPFDEYGWILMFLVVFFFAKIWRWNIFFSDFFKLIHYCVKRIQVETQNFKYPIGPLYLSLISSLLKIKEV